MSVAADQHIRIRLTPELKEQWDAVLESHKLTHQDAVTALMDWVIRQDGLHRAMIFGQVPGVDETQIASLLLEKMRNSGSVGTPAIGKRRKDQK